VDFARRIGVPFFETSAKLAQNISLLFESVTASIMHSSDAKPIKPSPNTQNIQTLLAEK